MSIILGLLKKQLTVQWDGICLGKGLDPLRKKWDTRKLDLNNFEMSFTNNSADFDYKVFAALTGHDMEIHSDAHHSGSNALLKEFDIISANELRNIVAKAYSDWHDFKQKYGYVTPVKNQGGCGSCWTFGAVGALEGLNKKKTQNLAQLSEQELLDCSGEYGTKGCKGGYASSAYEYVADNGGIAYEKDYPYKEKNQTCIKKSFPLAVPIDGYYMIPNGSEHLLQVAIATQGPVSVAIDVHLDFVYYKKGVYYNENCTTYNLNHEVVAVGYGSDEIDGDYWIIKNSWGVDWAEQGYGRMARNRGNNCGIASDANVPFIREN
ncbi:papain family cysteine protease domain-containing protein [Ditylenchus destructor]|nr:papain family cysteine protease domain-containing protein [Ditylenchus destructor]